MENVTKTNDIVEALSKVFDNIEETKKRCKEERTTKFLQRFCEHFQDSHWVDSNITVKKDYIVISDVELWNDDKCELLAKELSPAFITFRKGAGEVIVFRNKDYEKVSKFRKFFLKLWYNLYVKDILTF